MQIIRFELELQGYLELEKAPLLKHLASIWLRLEKKLSTRAKEILTEEDLDALIRSSTKSKGVEEEEEAEEEEEEEEEDPRKSSIEDED